jgi:hypothetical protein
MKLRLLPVLLTFFISGALLFGGWFTYHSFAVQDPIQEAVAGIASIENFTIDTNQDSVKIRVTLDEQANLHDVWHAIHEQVQSKAGNRTVEISIANEASTALNRIWSEVLFDIAEAMDTHKYSNIPVAMNVLSTQVEGLYTITAMDDHYVYLTMTLDGSYKYVVLPRSSRMGVWPNESL